MKGISAVTQLVEVIEGQGLAITPGASWSPVVRDELASFLADKVHASSRAKTQFETCKILARGIEPGAPGVSAGLVVGYVQSGKTTSFTAAAALARDNGFAIVIVIAGTSVNLLQQTQDRLQNDLRLGDMDAYRRWVFVKSPKPVSEEASKIEAALAEWLDPSADAQERASVLITVMKQHRHLEWLIGTLEDIRQRLDLATISALIIDDEADQASPNIKRQEGDESATYGRIRRLRACLPSHALLEYTATPQATLLVSLADELSPDFVCVIDPGDEYTGGRYFFQDHHASFAQLIPSSDVQVIDDESVDPPPTLAQALACFVIGCAAGRVLGSGPAQRSMLVHPSQKTIPQGRFVDWLKKMRDLWHDLLKLDPDDPDRQDLVTTLLAPAYAELATTASDIPPLEELLVRLPSTLKKTSIVQINAVKGKPEPVQWSTGYSWILVGGQLLDRGFTVEGLTVTYMPRGLGVGNADTIQQRARFFGYKRSYAGYCRAWLDSEVDAAFRSYVMHEEAMRDELVDVALSGQSLKDWKRVFLLSSKMKLTRANVIRLDTARQSFGNKWFDQQHFRGYDEAIGEQNRRVVATFTSALDLGPNVDGDPRFTTSQQHRLASASLGHVLEGLMQDYVMTDEDAAGFAALRLLLAVARDVHEETCRIYLMGGDAGAVRQRSVDRERRIKNLFQGKNAGTGYPGDRDIKALDILCIQLHLLDLNEEDQPAGSLATRVPAMAVWVPERFASSIIQQVT